MSLVYIGNMNIQRDPVKETGKLKNQVDIEVLRSRHFIVIFS